MTHTLRLESWQCSKHQPGSHLSSGGGASFLIVFGMMRICAVIFRYVFVKTFKHLAKYVGVYAALFFGTLHPGDEQRPRSVGLIQPAIHPVLFRFARIDRGHLNEAEFRP